MQQNGITVSIDYVRLIMHFALQYGLDAELVYREAGIDQVVLEKSDRIPLAQFNTFWETLEDKHLDRDLGLHLGEKVFVFPGHILFLMILNAPAIKEAIEKFCRYFNLLNNIFSPSFSIKEDMAALAIRFNTTDFKPSRHIYEGIMTFYASVLNRISENRIKLEGVYFVHASPEDISEHQRIFKAPLYFGQPENRLVFKSKYLTLPVHLSNQDLLVHLEELARKLQKRIYTHGPWSEKTSRLMIRMLHREKPKIESIAGNLSISRRHLQDNLKKEGTTYRKLLDNVRKEKALYFLEQRNTSLVDIAFLLGYSEQSVFNRAFKRWTGVSPNHYRDRRRQ